MNSQTRTVLFTVLVLLSFGVFQLASNIGRTGGAESSSVDPHSERVERIVNKHLSMTDQQLRIQEERARLEAMTLPAVGDRLWPAAKAKPEFRPQRDGVDLSVDPREQVAIDDLNRHPKDYGNYKSANSVIQNEQYLAEKDAIARRENQEKYAQQFIENARRQGYQVRLDSNFVVIDVHKISEQEKLQVRSPQSEGSK